MQKNAAWLKVWMLLSSLSAAIFVDLILFATVQLSIVTESKLSSSGFFFSIYYALLALVPCITIGFAIIAIARSDGKVSHAFTKLKIPLNVVNILVALILLLALFVLASLPVFIDIDDDPGNIAEIAVVYDESSMDRTLAALTIAPLAIELGKEHNRITFLRLDTETLGRVLNKAKYVFVFSHGMDGKILTPDLREVYSHDRAALVDKTALRYAYFTACYLGEKGFDKLWQKALAPAKAFLYSRMSAVSEHFLWIVFRAKAEM